MANDKITRGHASQFLVASELCRRGFPAVVTLGDTPNTDILCSSLDGTRFAHIQVKTFRPGDRTCHVGRKAENRFSASFLCVLCGLPEPEAGDAFLYYVIPAAIMADKVSKQHADWIAEPGRNGQQRNDSDIRVVHLPPF
jgi:hypothetical protein